MSFTTRGAVPGPPTGQSVASYDTYLDAQRAVDYLSDQQFPVQNLSIVGSDLRQIERVTGRLTWGRVILGGLLGGAWIGLLISLLLGLFATDAQAWWRLLLFCILWAAAFGIVFAAVGYAFSGGRRDFTSLSAIVASRYEVYCAHQQADRARQLLAQLSLKGTGTVTPAAAPTTPDAGPTTANPSA